MDERREATDDAQPPRLPLAAAGSRLSPVQEAYAAYTEHAIACDDCRNPGLSCEAAGVLWRAYMAIANQAAQKMG
ncbi:hypothetical protein ACFWPQ_01490 [Streptomyces sp. NPDC058464]|uniref:hypothetical protein n=1 Tax=Streptomyces sp. NPDC058464 TaxID=3346511 RepID=UPI00365C4397